MLKDERHYLKAKTQYLKKKPRNAAQAPQESSSINQLRGWQKCYYQNEVVMDDHHWHLCDKVWTLVSEINGKRPSKRSVASASIGSSLVQRSHGSVESPNMPAVEMATAVVSGGLSAVANISTSKLVDKTIRLRGEKCPRILVRLVLLYPCKADLERAPCCVLQFVFLLPYLLPADNEQIKNRLQLFIWSLLNKYGTSWESR